MSERAKNFIQLYIKTNDREPSDAEVRTHLELRGMTDVVSWITPGEHSKVDHMAWRGVALVESKMQLSTVGWMKKWEVPPLFEYWSNNRCYWHHGWWPYGLVSSSSGSREKDMQLFWWLLIPFLRVSVNEDETLDTIIWFWSGCYEAFNGFLFPTSVGVIGLHEGIPVVCRAYFLEDFS